MLKLRAIEEDELDIAAGLLTKGFPTRTLAFWQSGLRRLADYRQRAGAASIGSLLVADETPVGILLAIPRQDERSGRTIVNLSSWYVEESHRWSAARLIMAAMADKRATYTDLTPTEAAVEVNLRFGFRSHAYTLLLLFLPWLALVGSRKGRLMALDAVPPGAVDAALMRDLEYHRELGCIVTVIEAAGRHCPVAFDVIRRKGVPTARVVYAASMDVITDNLGPLARLLLGRGVALLTLQAGEGRTVPHAWVWKRGLCYQVKGDWDETVIDELYSERVLLKV